MRREMKHVRNCIQVSSDNVNIFGGYSLKKIPEADQKISPPQPSISRERKGIS